MFREQAPPVQTIGEFVEVEFGRHQHRRARAVGRRLTRLGSGRTPQIDAERVYTPVGIDLLDLAARDPLVTCDVSLSQLILTNSSPLASQGSALD